MALMALIRMMRVCISNIELRGKKNLKELFESIALLRGGVDRRYLAETPFWRFDC